LLGILIIITVHLFPLIQNVHGWRNGQNIDEFSSDPSNPNYGTHDWIAEHALDWLPENEKRYIVDNLASYLYGTELPDKTTGDNAIGDKDLHHYYFNENGDVMDNIAGIRAAQQYYNAVKKLEKGDLKNGTMRLGSMTHYISDLSVFGNVMSETYWGTAGNYSNYMSYVNSKMASYTSAEFDGYLNFDGRLALIEPDDAANAVAFNTTFDNNTIEARVQTGGKENCSWMEANYDWGDPVFKDRCGESLNYAVNLIADVLHSIYVQNLTPPSPPKNLAVSSVTGHSVNLTWKANPEDTLAGYSIYINKTDSSTQFYPTPINISRESTTYPYTGLIDEVKYYFKIVAFNMFDKTSGDSNIVSATTLDVTPPPVPSLANLPEITRKSVISISGISPEHGSLIEIYLNNDFSAPAYTNYSDPISGIYRVEIELVLGVNNITVRAVDDTGNPSAFSKSQLVIYDSIPPVADAGLNIELGMGKDPVVVVFNGSGSTDNLGILINYTWTLEIQYKYYYLYDKNPTFIFNKPDDYRIWLNVTDMAGNYDTDYFWVNVSQLDINRPYMTSQTPNIDETNVSVNITIRVKFNEPLNISTIKLTLKSNIG
jgi:hypothetical protein